MKKTVIVNLHQVVRMSHWEPSRFIQDDFDTLYRQIRAVKRLSFPGTYALKYDALMEPRYRRLLKESLDGGDELGAWWEITRPLCERAGVEFRGDKGGDRYDDRVDSAYSVGYAPQERKRLVDAYMEDFLDAFGKYPGSIGAWVLDPVTLEYAARRYGVAAGAICRDQLGVDGFSLWGGYPNGVYFPSRVNEYLPAQREENQLDIPVFRLLGPDPIYNFEAEVREGLQGVYTLEPAWLLGRDPKWIRWLFDSLTREDTLGVGYAQVGQENNFLWENIRPGLQPQLNVVAELAAEGKLRVETMAASACRFRETCRLTPPMTFQASRDWDESRKLSAQWYACAYYRVGFLWEAGFLRIRDCFLYREDYPSRYYDRRLEGSVSMADGLPVLFPQKWGSPRPFLRLLDKEGREPRGQAEYLARDRLTACCRLTREGEVRAEFTMTPEGIRLRGEFRLSFDRLPVYAGREGREIRMEHQGFSYRFSVPRGSILRAGKDGVLLEPDGGEIFLEFGERQTVSQVFRREYPAEGKTGRRRGPASAEPETPEISPGSSVFPWGETAEIQIWSHEPGVIRYTLDGREPEENGRVYSGPISIRQDTVVLAKLYSRSGQVSETVRAEYRFSRKDLTVTGPDVLDPRPVFRDGGLSGLLKTVRGSLDYLDGRWLGTSGELDLSCRLACREGIASLGLGCLSHHRSGVVYPRALTLYVGDTLESLSFFTELEIPSAPGAREIETRDFLIPVHREIGAFRLIVRRWEKMPGWCFYRGAETVFTMADNLLVIPE